MMTETEWTPGPWTVQKCSCDSPHCPLHQTSNGSFYQGTGYSLADAQLIAAAPELYATLDDMEYVVMGYIRRMYPHAWSALGPSGRPSLRNLIRSSANSALAKARGEGS